MLIPWKNAICNISFIVEAALCNTGNAQHDAQDRLLSRCNDFFPPRQRAVRYNPRLIRLNVARCKRGWKRMREREREMKGDGEIEAEAVTRVWRFARNHRAATIAIATTTVSPDERGSNSPRRKITLSRDTEHEVAGRGWDDGGDERDGPGERERGRASGASLFPLFTELSRPPAYLR